MENNYVRVPAHNWETRTVWRTEQVNVEVFNHETIYETRTRDVTQEKQPTRECPTDTEPDGQRCTKRVEFTHELATPGCPAGNWTLGGWTCSRRVYVKPSGCPDDFDASEPNYALAYNYDGSTDGYSCHLVPPEPRNEDDVSQVTPFGPNETVAIYDDERGEDAIHDGTRFAEDADHTYSSIETEIDMLDHWQPVFDRVAQNIYNPTDLNLTPEDPEDPTAEDFEADIQWYIDELTDQPPGVVGTYQCEDVISDTVCGRGEIRIRTDFRTRSVIRQEFLVCHELGHSIGFGHSGTLGSCMWSTVNDDNQLDLWEIDKINSHYRQ